MDNKCITYENVEQVYEIIKHNRLAIMTKNKEGERGEIHDADLSGFVFYNMDLRHAIFRNVNLTNAQFVECNLSYCMFIECTSDGNTINPAIDIDQCVSDALYIRKCNFASGILANRCRLTELNMKDSTIDGMCVESVEIYNSTIDTCTFIATKTKHCLISNTEFIDCFMREIGVDYGTIRKSRFQNCNLSRTHWLNIDLRDITFLKSNTSFMAILDSCLRDIEYIDCNTKRLYVCDSEVCDIMFDNYNDESQ